MDMAQSSGLPPPPPSAAASSRGSSSSSNGALPPTRGRLSNGKSKAAEAPAPPPDVAEVVDDIRAEVAAARAAVQRIRAKKDSQKGSSGTAASGSG